MTELVGTTVLLRLALRRDRWVLLVCVVALAVLTYSMMQATLGLYSAGVSGAIALMQDNPSILAIYGPLPARSASGLGVLEPMTVCSLAVSFLAFTLVRRHTRTEEETGRYEVLMVGIVGRRAPLAAACITALFAVLGAAAGCALGLLATPTAPAGATSFGACVVISGLVTIGITAVAVQLTSTSRGAAGWAIAAILLAYALRAVGDATHTIWLNRVSFLGWAASVAPYGANRWWLIGPAGLSAALLLAVADLLLHRRDLGAGLRAARPGPARGTIGSIWALAERLDRSWVRGWVIGYLVLGLLVGSLSRNAESMTSDPAVADMLRKMSGGHGTAAELFLGTELRFIALGAAAFTIATVARARGDEVTGRAELVLATRVRRIEWLGAHLLVALLGSLTLMVVVGVAAASGSSGAVGFGAATGAALAYVPAIWCCAAIATLLVACLPRVVAVSWAVLVLFVVLAEFGVLLHIPPALIALTPFDHAGSLPGGRADSIGLFGVTAVTLVLLTVAGVGLRRRDMAA